MTIDQLINVLAVVTLVEMMVTIGLGVTVQEGLAAVKDVGLFTRVAIANYIIVPAVIVGYGPR